ncbi:hypothetical protein Tco_0254251, partial [Tanacetum coccineum]
RGDRAWWCRYDDDYDDGGFGGGDGYNDDDGGSSGAWGEWGGGSGGSGDGDHFWSWPEKSAGKVFRRQRWPATVVAGYCEGERE